MTLIDIKYEQAKNASSKVPPVPVVPAVIHDHRQQEQHLKRKPYQPPLPAEHLRMPEERSPNLAPVHRHPVPPYIQLPPVNLAHKVFHRHPSPLGREQKHHSLFYTHSTQLFILSHHRSAISFQYSRPSGVSAQWKTLPKVPQSIPIYRANPASRT